MQIDVPKQSTKCLVRNYQLCDIRHIADIEFDPITKKYVGLPPGTKEGWIKRVSLDLLSGWVIIALPENEVAGRICLNRAKDRTRGVVEFEVIIGQNYWGRKLGREAASLVIPAAFQELKAVAVWAEVHPENKASLALLKDFGFAYLRDAEKKPMHLYELKNGAIDA